MMMPKLTICGGGNAAHVLIALASRAGWRVDILAPLADEAERLKAGVLANGGVRATFGQESVTGFPHQISAQPADVIPGSELILLALPAFAHGNILQTIAPYLDPDAAVGALPARGGFDYQAQAILDLETRPRPLFGLQTLPWACRIVTYGQVVEVLGTKTAVDVAVCPAGASAGLVEKLEALLGLPVRPVRSFLTLTLANTGQLIHPGIMYGLGRGQEQTIFAAEEIPLFYQGVDQPTADLLAAMSDEVQAISRSLAARVADFEPGQVVSLYDWLRHAYGSQIDDSSSLRRAFNTNRAYTGLRLPTRPAGPNAFTIDFTARYLAEDVPFGLVVLRGIAELAGVASPTIDRVIGWAQARLQKEYLVNGRLAGEHLSETRAPQAYGILDFRFLDFGGN